MIVRQESLIESAAVLRAQVVAKQVQIEGMRSFRCRGQSQSRFLPSRNLLRCNRNSNIVAGSQTDTGSDINLSKGRVTQAGMEYIRRYRDLKYQETVFELLAKEFEVAKLDEAREGSIIQVVDAAVPPDKKSSPHRTLIVLAQRFLLSLLPRSGSSCGRVRHRAFELPENRERLEAIRRRWKAKQDTR